MVQRAYVLNRDSHSISVIDTATDSAVATIDVGDGPTSLAVTPDGRRLYVVLAAGIVQAIDTTLNESRPTLRSTAPGAASRSPPMAGMPLSPRVASQ